MQKQGMLRKPEQVKQNAPPISVMYKSSTHEDIIRSNKK